MSELTHLFFTLYNWIKMDDILVAYDMDHVQDMQYSLKEEEIIAYES